ncbi:MAG: DUF1629 domain-containing protein [Terricaulis sp.]
MVFTRTQNPEVDEPSFYKVSTLGGYMNNGLPKTSKLLSWETLPTPARWNRAYRALSSLGEIEVEFNGDPNWMADLYRLNTALYLVSESILNLILECDPSAIETSKPRIVGKHGSLIRPYWVVMPCRAVDAVDITKSNVEVRRPAVYRGASRYVTHVYYRPGFSIQSQPSETSCFLEEFSGDWFWRKSMIEAAAERGIRGLLFGYGQVRDSSREIRLRGPNDPLDW